MPINTGLAPSPEGCHGCHKGATFLINSLENFLQSIIGSDANYHRKQQILQRFYFKQTQRHRSNLFACSRRVSRKTQRYTEIKTKIFKNLTHSNFKTSHPYYTLYTLLRRVQALCISAFSHPYTLKHKKSLYANVVFSENLPKFVGRLQTIESSCTQLQQEIQEAESRRSPGCWPSTTDGRPASRPSTITPTWKTTIRTFHGGRSPWKCTS